MSSNRQWMYKRLTKGLYDPEFLRGVQQFIEFAMSHPEGRDGERLRCPSNRKKCQNRNFENVHTVHGHLLKKGFVPGYHVWYLHGESEVAETIDQDETMHNWEHTMNNLPVDVSEFDDPGPSRLACPYCMKNSDAFTLTKGGKQSWFDNHRKFLPINHPYRKDKNSFRKNRVVTMPPTPLRSGEDVLKEIEELGLKKVTELGADIINRQISKFSGWKKRSIFWDLPYWSTNFIRHNLDVMHIEKNFFENVFNTVLEVDGKTKDNPKSREDLKEFCRRPELHVVDGKNPKAIYTLKEESKKLLCEWVKNLKFPNGYVSNMGRCVDMKKHKLFGMKSHDCHVVMQRLVPVAFRELLPKKVWEALTEMSLFFRDITSTVIREEDMVRLQQKIPEILCKLEHVFPPSFFDSMEHLPVHLAYEAMIVGPVQYRWMYPFER
ncbi:hypothetical protein MTR67_051892 [Solanum verrucosum]|uniref:DUF4218 domain-containing protein n=1 Tax=Solanum verrucosum TaxID=315347 RepID=A0AAF0V585_SOLVR|nr:hypothetical protein MTR67_051892 [Solanum verrucosum]